jgi:hypothetical protein
VYSVPKGLSALRRTFDTGKPTEHRTTHIFNHSGRRPQIRISAAIPRVDHKNFIGGVETFLDLIRLEKLRKKASEPLHG